MRKTTYFFTAAVFATVSLFLLGCQVGDPLTPTSGYATSADGSSTLPRDVAQFNDIPIPEKALMDTTRSIILGGQSDWTGRLVFSAPYSTSALFDFYMGEMPKFGWTEVTAVRSETSNLIYKRDSRVANIQLKGSGSSSEVVFTVSPPTAARTK